MKNISSQAGFNTALYDLLTILQWVYLVKPL